MTVLTAEHCVDGLHLACGLHFLWCSFPTPRWQAPWNYWINSSYLARVDPSGRVR